MRAYDLAGRRRAAGIGQELLARQMALPTDTLRSIELGAVDITKEQYERILSEIDVIATKERS